MKIRITNPIINSIYEVGQILTVKEKHDDGVFVLEGEQGVYNQEFEVVEEMTPQQKLERLIELAKESKEILDSMDWKDAARVISVDVDRTQSIVLMSDFNDFKTLYPIHQVEEADNGLSYRLTAEDGDIQIVAYERRLLA